ncbi:MAG: hypothetical protein VYB50_00190 [Candidatus Thermoplasmatota archaeon]|nr:hypothetical protein [Candidatus Thermoplasmatota archaeon]
MGEKSPVLIREEGGKIHLVHLVDEMMKIKGLGVFNPSKLLCNLEIGDNVEIGQKNLQRVPMRLPEFISCMKRRAQTISAKDAGWLISNMGIGSSDVVLDAGLGSAGLALHLAQVLNPNGLLITVEVRDDHASVGLENLTSAKECFPEFPNHEHYSGLVQEVVKNENFPLLDACILDMPDHCEAIHACSEKLRIGARLACYAPNSVQVERCWLDCENVGLEIEHCVEIIERPWSRTSKGGMRPSKGLFGHTAFLLVAKKVTQQL